MQFTEIGNSHQNTEKLLTKIAEILEIRKLEKDNKKCKNKKHHTLNE